MKQDSLQTLQEEIRVLKALRAEKREIIQIIYDFLQARIGREYSAGDFHAVEMELRKIVQTRTRGQWEITGNLSKNGLTIERTTEPKVQIELLSVQKAIEITPDEYHFVIKRGRGGSCKINGEELEFFIGTALLSDANELAGDDLFSSDRKLMEIVATQAQYMDRYNRLYEQYGNVYTTLAGYDVIRKLSLGDPVHSHEIGSLNGDMEREIPSSYGCTPEEYTYRMFTAEQLGDFEELPYSREELDRIIQEERQVVRQLEQYFASVPADVRTALCRCGVLKKTVPASDV